MIPVRITEGHTGHGEPDAPEGRLEDRRDDHPERHAPDGLAGEMH
jgi:hypothetical protein